jgi:hypothetical protein
VGRAGIRRRKRKQVLPKPSQSSGEFSGLDGTFVGGYYGLNFVRNLGLRLRHRRQGRRGWQLPPLAAYIVLGAAVVTIVGGICAIVWLLGHLS